MNTPTQKRKLSWLSPAIILVIFTTAFIAAIWLSEQNIENTRRLHLMTDIESVGESIQLVLQGNRDYLLMLAKDRAENKLDTKTFQERASKYVSENPELLNINWVDQNFLITDVAPLEQNKQVVGLHLDLPEPKRASSLAKEIRKPVYTNPFVVVQGQLAFEIWVPVYQDDTFLGLFGGVYSWENVMNRHVPPQMINNYYISLLDTNDKKFFAMMKTGDIDDTMSYQIPLEPAGIILQFEGYGDGINWLITGLEIFCLLLVSGLGFTIWRLRQEIENRKNYTDKLKDNDRKLQTSVQTLEMLSGCNQVLVRSTEEKQLLQEICNLIISAGKFELALIAYTNDQSEIHFMASAGASAKRYMEIAKRSVDDPPCPCRIAIQTGKAFIEQDITLNKSGAPWVKEALENGFSSCIALPLKINSVVGALSVFSNKPNIFTPEEVTLFSEFSSDLAFGIKTLRTAEEEKKAKKAMQASEEKFSKAFQTSSTLMAITTLKEGRFIEINEAYCKLLGYSREDCINHTTIELNIWADPSQREKVIQEIQKKGRLNEIEVQLRKFNGQLCTVLLSMSPITIDNQTYLLTVAVDVTEKKRAELEKEQYLKFFKLSIDAMAIADPFGCFKHVNPAFVKLTGFSEEELISKPFMEYVIPEDRERTTKEMELQVKVRSSLNFENHYIRKDGSTVLLSWTAFFDKQDGVTYAIARDITLQKKAEEQVKKAGLYNRKLIETSLDPLVTIGFNGKISDVNKATETVTGRTRQELIGTEFSTYFSDPAKAQAGYQEVFKKGFVRDYPLEIRHLDGHLVPVLYNASVYTDENGEEIGVFAAARDITKQKQAEEQVKKAGLYNRKLIETSLDPLVTIGFDGKITDVNKATETVTGRTRQELIGTEFSTYFSDPAKAQAGYQEVFKKGFVRDYPLEIRHLDGHLVPVLYNASVYTDENGEIIGVFAAARDITEQKKAEDALQSSERRLKEAQEMARMGNWDWDAVHDKIWWSEEYYKIIGADPTKAPPDYNEHLKIYTTESAERLDLAVKNSMKTGEPYALDLEVVNPTSTAKWIHATAEVRRDQNNKICGIKGTVQDITEKKKNELSIKELSELRSKFLNIISHQLRTPLTSVIWNLETILRGNLGKLDKPQEKFLQVTYEASEEINKRLDALLKAIDIEEGRVLLNIEDVAITNVTAAVMNEAGKKAFLKDLEFNYEAPEHDISEIRGDSTMLRFVISKLTENAIAYTHKGGKISAKLLQHDGNIRFEIRDDGIGIPSSEQHHVFERFFRASNAATMQPDSFGLGLYIAKNFIEQHQGKIGFISKEGIGTTFWFEIPKWFVA